MKPIPTQAHILIRKHGVCLQTERQLIMRIYNASTRKIFD